MRARTWAASLLGAALAITVAACDPGGGGVSTGECTDDVRSAGQPGDAEPLLVLGGMLFTPTIVYSDGAVVMPVQDGGAGAAGGFMHLPMMMPGYWGDQPGVLSAGSLTDCELEALVEAADDLFVANVDFGDPQVTDMPSTRVSYDGQSFSIYAFSRSDADEWGDLSGSQAQNRRDLADLWNFVVDEAEISGLAEVEKMYIHTYSGIADDELVDWPLDEPFSQVVPGACATITDPAQIEALTDRLDDGPELLEEQEWRLAILNAAPGAPDCEG